MSDASSSRRTMIPLLRKGRVMPRSFFQTISLSLLLLVFMSTPAVAQAIATVTPDEEAEQNKLKGFSLKKEESSVTNALEDFDRYAEKKEWEKAFRAVSTVADAQANGMVLYKDGLMIPTRQRLLRSLLTLPPEGKQAFRLFFNPKAKQEFEAFRTRETEQGAVDPTPLRKVVESYFVTETGDQAADYLANIYFQNGEFTAAAGMWKMLLDHYPDSDLSSLRIEVKRAVALARSEQWADFDQAASRVKERYSGQSVTLGGKEHDAAQFLASLGADRTATPPTESQPSEASTAGADLRLPSKDDPAWQVRFADDTLREAVQQLMNQGWWIQTDVTNCIPASAADDKRVYMNWIGVCFAIDIETGKLLWRTDKFTDLSSQAQQIVQSGISLPRYTITPVGKDRVLYTRIPLDKLNHHQEPYRIVCVVADTGEVKWNTEKITGLENWSFIGKPLLMSDGQTLYTFASQRGGSELNLMSLDFESGKLNWSLPLGTPQAGNDRRGQPLYPEPVLIPYEGMLYVLTNNGAVICLRPDAKRIEWASTYAPAPQLGEQQQMWWNGMPVQDREIDTPGVAILQGGVLYIKESRGDELYALDLAEKSVKWHRPVESSDMLAGIDKHIYLVGNEISALDRTTRNMLWSTKLPIETGTMRPLIAGDRAYVLTGRGVFEIDTGNGDVTHILRSVDQDAVGGALWVSGDRLITVSNSAITAYPLTREEPAKTAAN